MAGLGAVMNNPLCPAEITGKGLTLPCWHRRYTGKEGDTTSATVTLYKSLPAGALWLLCAGVQ